MLVVEHDTDAGAPVVGNDDRDTASILGQDAHDRLIYFLVGASDIPHDQILAAGEIVTIDATVIVADKHGKVFHGTTSSKLNERGDDFRKPL